MRIVFVLLASIIIIVMLLFTRQAAEPEQRILVPVQVATGYVERVDIQPVMEVIGRLHATHRASLSFEVSGVIKERAVEVGQVVDTGAVLLRIQEDDFVDAVAQQDAVLSNERHAIKRDHRLLELLVKESEIQEREVGRMETLSRQSQVSQSRYEEAQRTLIRLSTEQARLRYQLDSAESRLMIAELALSKAQRALARTVLHAPFQGVVNAVYAEVGDYFSLGQVAIEILQREQLDLHMDISHRIAMYLQLGQQVAVYVDDRPIPGVIIALSVDPDLQTHTQGLRIRLPGEGLFPGQLGKARLPGRHYQHAKVVPASAILYDAGKTFLFRVEGNRLIKVPIVLIERIEQQYIIDGIDSAALIVIRDVSSFAEGQLVNIDQVAAP